MRAIRRRLASLLAVLALAGAVLVPVALTDAAPANASQNCYHWEWWGYETACINQGGLHVYWTSAEIVSQITDAWTMETFSPYADWHWGPTYLGAGDGWIEAPTWNINVASGTEIGFRWCVYGYGCMTQYIQVLGV